MNRTSVRIGIVLLCVVAIFTAVYFFGKYHKYDTVDVNDSIKVKSGYNSEYVPFGDFVCMYLKIIK